jgi:nitroreductase
MTTDEHVSLTVMASAVADAVLAPSVYNTQPWKFHLAGDRIELFADRSRQAMVLDPTGRQLYISCGAALHHLEVALRGAGCDLTIEVLPDNNKDHLAAIVVKPGQPPDEREQTLAAAIPQRHSQREPFSTRPVSPQALRELRKAAEAEGGWVVILQNRDDQITLAVLQAHADQAEIGDPAYQAELLSWRRTEPTDDGIPDSALPTVGQGRHSDVVLRNFTTANGQNSRPVDARGTQSPPDERPALLIIGTDCDGPAQWLEAGRALSHLLLTATGLGLRASMLGQVIDLPGARSQLRHLMRLVGEPQMVLRLGYGPPAAATPRRPLSEVID